MTTVEINDRVPTRIKDIKPGELFRHDIDGDIFLMADEEDKDGKAIALYITNSDEFKGILMHFDKVDRATILDGAINVYLD